MVKLYGAVNGFGWKFNEVIGAQIVSVPAKKPDEFADKALKAILIWLAGIFGAVFLAANIAVFLFSCRYRSRSLSSPLPSK